MTELFTRADDILRVALPEPVEQMVVALLRETIVMPITVSTALEICAELALTRIRE